MLAKARAAYEQLRDERDGLQREYDALDNTIYLKLRGGKKSYFRPQGLPRATTLPAIADLFDPTSTLRIPAQRALMAVIHHRRWLDALAAARLADVDRPHATTRNCEATRVIANAQEGASGVLDLVPDGTYQMRVDSPEFQLHAIHITTCWNTLSDSECERGPAAADCVVG